MSDAVYVDGRSLTIPDVARVARELAPTRLDAAARARMERSHAWVQQAADGEIRDAHGEPLPVYGVNTGYGSLARMRIPPTRARDLSWNLIQSHTAGVGPPIDAPTTRAMMVLRANALAKGASGCRPLVVETLLEMLNRDVVPVVPSRGSCGSSGDLAPLAHLGLVLFRGHNDDHTGEAWLRGERIPAAEAMARAGLERLEPGPKDGLAITNGAQLCTAIGALACADTLDLVRHAEIAAAMSWEALRGVTRALHPDVHALRPYPGAIACASNLCRLLDGSELVNSEPGKVQDAYSLRCTPQVLGAVRDGLRFATGQIGVEVNAATDNPLILVDADTPNKAYSAGLFHGEPVGMATDHLKLVLCELGALAERRVFRLTTGSLSARLPPLLSRRDRSGMGLMVPQSTAAALVAENRSLAWPNTSDSIPTCEDQEDLVAMSTAAARRAAEVVVNTRRIVAIELLSAATGLVWRRENEPTVRLGRGTEAALTAVEAVLGNWSTPAEDIAAIDTALLDGRILSAVEDAVGPLEGIDG